MTAVKADPLDVANRLRPVLLQLNRYLRREVHSLGVTASQVSFLAAINAHPGIGVGELAAREAMSAPAVSGHLDKLEAAGLIARVRASEGDRRRVGLSVTPEGESVVLEVRSRRTAWLASRMRGLTDGDLATIEAAIEPLRRLLGDEGQ